jgi:hypothetical protein
MTTEFKLADVAVLARQNVGTGCPTCQSKSGHFRHCSLINRASAEAHTFTQSKADVLRARAFGVDLTR